MIPSVTRKQQLVISVKDHGATGNGTSDDTAAVQAAITAAMATSPGGLVWFPAGVYIVSAQLTGSNMSVALCGAGKGVSVIRWSAGAATTGISLAFNSDTQHASVSGLSLETAKKTGTALQLDYTNQVDSVTYPGQSLTLNRSSPRAAVSDLWIRGSGADRTATGWDYGINIIAAINVSVSGCAFEGWYTSGAPHTWGSVAAFRFVGTSAAYENGHPVEFKVTDCVINFASNGILFSGVEGGTVTDCSIISVTNGVNWEDAFGRPHLSVKGCHINAHGACILADDLAEGQITGNDLYRSTDASGVCYGVLCNGTQTSNTGWHSIIGNAFTDSESTLTITSSSVANPSVITMAANHSYQTGDSVTIAGHSGSTPSINGTHTITRVSATTFTIPVNVTVGGTGGTTSRASLFDGVSVTTGKYGSVEGNAFRKVRTAVTLGASSEGWVVGPANTYQTFATKVSDSGTSNISIQPYGTGSLPAYAGMHLTGNITPTALAAATNDWSPTGLSTATIIRAEASAAHRDLTGIAAQSAGRLLFLRNSGTTYNIVLKHYNGGSSAANRFQCPNGADVTVRPQGGVLLIYDATAALWLVEGA